MGANHSCKKCNAKYWRKPNLKKHVRSHQEYGKGKYKNNLFESGNHLRSYNEYKCSKCSGVFDTQMELSKHSRSHEEYKCSKCSGVFDTQMDLSRHSSSHEDRAYNNKYNGAFETEQNSKMDFRSHESGNVSGLFTSIGAGAVFGSALGPVGTVVGSLLGGVIGAISMHSLDKI